MLPEYSWVQMNVPGSSGSPPLNKAGEVTGILWGGPAQKSKLRNALAVAIPSDDARFYYPHLIGSLARISLSEAKSSLRPETLTSGGSHFRSGG